MGVEELRQTLAQHHLVLLDTMVFSYHLSAHPRYAPLSRVVLEAVESGQVIGLMTTVTLAEVLSLPAQMSARAVMLEYELYLTHFPNLRLVPLDAALAREAAWVRGTTGLRLPDAVQVAAARLSGADGIVTNDRRWVGRVSRPPVVMLEDYL
ncbi:MAG: type II toxin-antitoxin system VapC family toxin [Anaerolineae bacterium]|nr:type II toxin-antitoxin system VapC family toxin [Anaerolineae bacterium]